MIGIDVSKLTLDAWVYLTKKHKQFSNNEKGFKQLIKWTQHQIGEGKALEKLAFCFEHTGLYSLPLSVFLSKQKQPYYQVSGLLVKRSLGLVRGKNDKVDARNLARFAYLHQQELQPYQLPGECLIRLKQLLSFRDKLVRQCRAQKAYLKESKQILKEECVAFIHKSTEELITMLNKKIKEAEREMLLLITSNKELAKNYELITGIKGVGLILSTAIITSTNNFQSFKTWRQFACYAGIAPFEHQSGTSFHGKTRVSSLGNRYLKTLLSQAAATAIQYNPEMKIYYQRRLKEGKNKMSTLNIIRNKLVSRVFAVISRQTPFIDIHKFAA